MITRFKIETDEDKIILSIYNSAGVLEDIIKTKSNTDNTEKFFDDLRAGLSKIFLKK